MGAPSKGAAKWEKVGALPETLQSYLELRKKMSDLKDEF